MANSSFVNSALLWISAKSQTEARVSWLNLEERKNGTKVCELNVPAFDLSKESKIASNCCFFSNDKVQSDAALLKVLEGTRTKEGCLDTGEFTDKPVEEGLKDDCGRFEGFTASHKYPGRLSGTVARTGLFVMAS